MCILLHKMHRLLGSCTIPYPSSPTYYPYITSIYAPSDGSTWTFGHTRYPSGGESRVGIRRAFTQVERPQTSHSSDTQSKEQDLCQRSFLAVRILKQKCCRVLGIVCFHQDINLILELLNLYQSNDLYRVNIIHITPAFIS